MAIKVSYARPVKDLTIQGICASGTAYLIPGHQCPAAIHGGGKIEAMELRGDMLVIRKTTKNFGSFSSATNRMMGGNETKHGCGGTAAAVHVSKFNSIVIDEETAELAKAAEPVKAPEPAPEQPKGQADLPPAKPVQNPQGNQQRR